MIRNTLFEGYEGPRLTPQVQMKRLQRVMDNELTPVQRKYLSDYFFEEMTMTEIARKHSVDPSTVCRTIQRAVRRCRRCLRY